VANILAVSAWRQGTDPAEHMQATRNYWSAIEPFTRGFYVNDLAREATPKDIDRNFRGNYARLVAIKKTCDPTNLFRLNANIQPPRA
jgi:FAD/FMN-containing dehydrogenase